MRTVIAVLAIVLATTALDAQPLIGQRSRVVVSAGDTLSSLASRLGIDPLTIARDNGRRLDAPLAVGDTLTVDNRHIVPPLPPGTTLLINVPQRMLFLDADGGVTGYPVAVGRPGWPTPLGAFAIVTRETNPTWDVPASIREEARLAGRPLPAKVPPGPANPLGAHWLGVSVGGIGIHGTNAPSSVYHAITHGCIRLSADNIAALFGAVQVGTTGTLVYQPVLVAFDGDDVFVEAHPDVYRRGPRDVLALVKEQTRALNVSDRVDWNVVSQVIRERAGVARVVTR